MGKKTVPIADQIVPRRRDHIRTKIRYRCIACGRQFQNHSRKKQIEKTIWNEYVYQRQTIRALSQKYKRSKDWIRERINNVPAKQRYCSPRSVVVIADVTFFGRSSAICVIRAPHLKKNLYVREVQTESVDVYWQGRMELERQGYTIQAIVLDGRPGVRQIFSDIPVQMCHFHQKTNHHPLFNQQA